MTWWLSLNGQASSSWHSLTVDLIVNAAIPATVVAAASFDDMVAITGYTIFINLAVQGEGDRGWAIAHGPLSVVFGILAGLLAAVFCSITVLWNNKFKRTFMLFFTGTSGCFARAPCSETPS